MMKLNKREKLLIILFLIGALGMGFYKYIYTPQVEDIQSLQQRVGEVENAIRINKLQASSDNNVFSELKETRANINLITERFYPVLVQEKFILEMDQFIKKSGVSVKSISFVEPDKAFIEDGEEIDDSSMLEGYVNIYKNITGQITESLSQGSIQASSEKVDEAKNKDDDLKDKVEKMSVSISFTATYKQLKDFVQMFQDLNKNILITQLTISNSLGDILICNMTMDYYALPQIDIEENSYFQWDLRGKFGKDNPFTIPESINEVSEEERVQQVAYKNQEIISDFQLGLYPVSADVPSVILGKTDDGDGTTYVFGDNEGYEPVEIMITKETGGYAYKYRTSANTYPSDYKSTYIPFTPKGQSIRVNILSSPRKEDLDQSGVLLTVINKSDLNVVLDITEIEQHSRIQVTSTVGPVVVERNN